MKKIDGKIVLTDDEAIKRITDFIKDTDADILAGVLGTLFGGDCFAEVGPSSTNFDILYVFTPNKDYGGEFDEVDNEGNSL